MKTHPLYPMIFAPVYKDYIWGGQRIAAEYNRGGTPSPCAESWELSGLSCGESIIANGAFEGIGLAHLAQTFGPELTGTAAPHPEIFPLLIKIIDAADRLSVQVHPDAEAAAELGGQSKHEMWYVLDTKPDSVIWAGIEPGSDPADAPNHLLAHAVRPGDIFDIPAGLVHAIGAGNLIYEVQQPSNTTYRISDWGRGRETHLAQSIRSIHPELHPLQLSDSDISREFCPRLVTPDFTFATLDIRRQRTMATKAKSPMALFCASGKVSLEHCGPHPLTLLPGDLVLVPPSQRFELHPLAPTRLLVSSL